MKTKGITIWEQHAEKIVLSVAGVVCVVLVGRQFIGEPNAVTMPGDVTVAPDEIDGLLGAEAERLLSRLDETAPSEIELPEPESAYQSLVKALADGVSPQVRLGLAEVGLGPRAEWIGPSGEIKFAVPRIRPPYQLVVKTITDALEDGVVAEHPVLEALFDDPDEPRDINYATVFARFSLADLTSQFAAEGSDEEAIPASWYRDRADNIVDVVIQRQELLDGEWSEPVTLTQIPGRHTFRKELAGKIDAGLRDQILANLDEPAIRLDIIQPKFYPTRNEEWGTPALEQDLDQEIAEANDGGARLRRVLADLKKRRERANKKLEDFGGSFTETPPEEEDVPRPPPRRPGGGGRKGPPGGRGGQDFGPGGSGEGKRDKGGGYGTAGRNKKAVENLKKKIAKLDDEIAEARKRLWDLIGDEEVAPDDEALLADEGPALAGADEIWLWGHDLYVEPGKTYRYAASVKIYNPFFGKKRSLVDEQQEMAESFSLESAASEWSEPLRVNPPIRVFIIAAKAAGQGIAGMPGSWRVTAEVHRFYDGRQWMETFSVHPGDFVGSVKNKRTADGGESLDIDFRTGLFVLDIIEDIGAIGRIRLPNNSRSAKVLLQDVRTGEVLELRDPRMDLDDPERRRLKVKAES